MPLSELLSRLVLDGRRAVARDADGDVTAEVFLARVQAWQQGFDAAPGRRYALYLEDSVAFAAALFGAWHAGKIVYLAADTLPSTVRAIGSEVDGFAGAFAGALQPAPVSITVAADWQPLDPEAERLVLYTSGSQGDPVAIAKNLRQLDVEIATLESLFGERVGTAVVQATVSHQHIYGLLFRVLWPLSATRIFAAQRLGYPEQIAAAIADEGAILVASPALLRRIPEALDWSSLRSSLRMVFCSGGPLPAEAATAIEQLWRQPLVEVFGSTETGGIATREGGRPWRVLPGVEWRIDEERLQIRSAHLPRLDWFETQDRVEPAGEGFILRGRVDRLVKLEERRISLGAIERGLQASAWIRRARALLLAGERTRIAAVAELSDAGRELLRDQGRKSLIDGLRAALRGQVDEIAIPRHWRFVDALPVDSQGKSSERRLAELFQELRPVPTWLRREPASAQLTVAADARLAVFDGHFEQTPILPGVALLDWAIGWGREAFAIGWPVLRLEAMKFQRVVAPGTELHLDLAWQGANSALSFRFESSKGVHAGGRILFDAPAASI